MSAHGVEQLVPLQTLFADALALARPASVAIFGIAGGNGLDAIDSSITTRVVGFDIHQDYLDSVATRYSDLPGLVLHRLDLAVDSVSCPPVAMVHIALILEHAGTAKCLENAIGLVAPGGHLSVVLQLPSKAEQGVSPTPFASLQALKPNFQFVPSDWLVQTLAALAFQLEQETTVPLPAGKAFWHGIFCRSQPD